MRQVNPVSNRRKTPVAAQAPEAAIARWVQRTLAADPPRAKSLIVTVWGDALAPHGGAVWLAGLIRLMAPFHVNDRLVRTSVFRLARDGWLDASAHGRRSRYRLTRDGARRFDDAYRRIYDRPPEDWHGQWELVLVNGVPAGRRAALRDELAWAGFGELGAGSFLRPSEPGRPLPSILATYDRSRPHRRRAGDRLSRHACRSRRPWTTRGTWTRSPSHYRQFLQRFGAVIERFRAGDVHDPAQCFVVRTLLIHAYRRVLLRDPLLPAALLPLDWPGAAAYALCRDFYRLTHRSAEAHLAATLADDGDPWPPANAAFYARFGGLAGA